MKTVNWTLDPAHSEILFKVKHLMLTTVTGHFGSFKAEAVTDDENFNHTRSIRFTADVHSIHTKNTDRDAHLKSPDFFNADEFPQLEFRADNFNASTGKMEGNLTIRGTTRPVTFETEFNGIAEDPMGQQKAGFSLTGKINRKDFGLHWSAVTETGGVIVADEVKILAEIQLLRAVAEKEMTKEEFSLEGNSI